jgi:hypothetical protein
MMHHLSLMSMSVVDCTTVIRSKALSLENFPDNEISFEDLIDGRLERFGITTDGVNQPGVLFAPNGSSIVVTRTDTGNVQFPESMPVLIRNAIATEFKTDLADYGEPTHVVVEGPSCGDAEFIRDWLNAAVKSDQVLQLLFELHPGFRRSISRLETMYSIEFATAATAFVRKWLKDRQTFSLNLRDSMWIEIFTIMVGVGFFTRTGGRYQMVVPSFIGVNPIIQASLRYAESEDADYFLHPERHLVTVTGYQAKFLRQKLSSMDLGARLAERERLLAA